MKDYLFKEDKQIQRYRSVCFSWYSEFSMVQPCPNNMKHACSACGRMSIAFCIYHIKYHHPLEVAITASNSYSIYRSSPGPIFNQSVPKFLNLLLISYSNKQPFDFLRTQSQNVNAISYLYLFISSPVVTYLLVAKEYIMSKG